jgi:hypothetical protein
VPHLSRPNRNKEKPKQEKKGKRKRKRQNTKYSNLIITMNDPEVTN